MTHHLSILVRAVVVVMLAWARPADANPIYLSPGPIIDFGPIPTGTTSMVFRDAGHDGGPPHIVNRLAPSATDCAAYTFAIGGITVDSNGNLNPDYQIGGLVTQAFGWITFSPQVTQDTFDCTITFESSPGVSAGSFQLKGKSTAPSAPEIVLTPITMIDIGNVSLGQMGMGQITVQNIGNAPLIYSFNVSGTAAGFTSAGACVPNCMLMGGDGMTHTVVTFTPQMLGGASGELDVSSNDSNEMLTMIPLSGTGVMAGNGGMVSPTTGVLAFGKVPVGSTATRSFEIMNSGTGAITLTSAAFGNPVFATAPTSSLPITIGAGATGTIDLTCTPAARTTYTSAATLATTAGNGNISLSLSCVGAAEVTLSDAIGFGVTPVGSQVRLSGVIDLHNINASATFLVREVKLADDTGAFSIDATAGMISPDGHLLGDATFTPLTAGPYEARVEVYLDDDPTIHGQIPLTGHAIELEPGGGCATGGPLGLAMVIVVLVALRRRWALAFGAVLAFHSTSARADDLVMQTYRPALSVGQRLFAVESAVVEPTSWMIGIAAGYARDPLRIELVDCGGECPPGYMRGDTTSVIQSQGLFALGAAFAYAGRAEFGFSVPLLIQTGRDSVLAPAADGVALGDIAARAKIALLRSSAMTIGAGLIVTVPTATDGQYAGSDGPTGRVVVRAAWDRAKLHVATEAGVLGRRSGELGTLRQGSELDAGAGVAYRVHDRVIVTAEVFGSIGLVEGSDGLVQSLVGVRAALGPELAVGVAGGAAIVPGAGAPSMRGLLVVTYTPRSHSASPLIADSDVLAIPVPRSDRDADGIEDTNDRCPAEAEDRDGHDDTDGCPDLDDDQDGVPDTGDRCPAAAEDRDGFEDSDGCPDLDNDADGVADTADRCPAIAGTAALDGCPEDDQDHDGVVDVSDRCPTTPETINGKADDDGCPDAGDSLVLVGRSRIDLFDAIRFTGETAVLDAASTNVLSQLALALRADRAIQRVQVIVHVRARSSGDTDLSRSRAAAVIEALTARGVAATRLEAIGVGSDRPLASATPGAAINDRVELSITARSPQP